MTDKELQARYPAVDAKIDWRQLQAIAKKHTMTAQLLRPTAEELREVAVPALAKMQNGGYVVLAVNNDEAVFLIDPNLDKAFALPRQQFLEVWSGELLTFSAKFSWQFVKKKYNLDWFFMVLRHYKKYLYEVLAAAFFLQLMGIAMPLLTQVIIDKVIGNHGISTLTVLGTGMVVFFLLQAMLSGLRTYLLNHTTNKLDAILGTRPVSSSDQFASAVL